MAISINLSKNKFNPVYLPYVEAKNRFQIYYGGAGSGKSVFCAQKAVLLSFKNFQKILVVRKYANTNRNSTYALILNIIRSWNLSSLFTINLLRIINNNTKSLIIFTGLDDVLKLKSISNITTVWILLATLISYLDFHQINLRLRGKYISTKHQIMMSFNPIHNLHWIKRIFFDTNTYPAVSILKTTYKDNNFLDDEYIQLLNQLKLTSPYHYEVYCLGDWGSTGLLVYNNFEVKLFNILEILANSSYIRSGLDFGFIDPTAVCLVAIYEKDIYICSEIYRRKLNSAELAAVIKLTKHIPSHPIIADSAAPMQIALLQKAGLPVVAISKKTIKEGISNLKTRKIIIHPSCINFISLISTYSYVKDKRSGEYTELIVDNMNHLMDALRYATQQHFIDYTGFQIGQL